MPEHNGYRTTTDWLIHIDSKLTAIDSKLDTKTDKEDHQRLEDRVGGVDVGVTEPFRQLSDRPSRLQRERGKRMPQGVAGPLLGDAQVGEQRGEVLVREADVLAEDVPVLDAAPPRSVSANSNWA